MRTRYPNQLSMPTSSTNQIHISLLYVEFGLKHFSIFPSFGGQLSVASLDDKHTSNSQFIVTQGQFKTPRLKQVTEARMDS